jgi:hypothetical protein
MIANPVQKSVGYVRGIWNPGGLVPNQLLYFGDALVYFGSPVVYTL